MTEFNGGSAKADHLCVLVHGLWGQPAHLASVAGALRAAYAEDQLHLLVAESNSGYFTYDGIDTGGERVCLEIEKALDGIAAARGGRRVAKLSVVGYSLGGLVARYAVGLLHAKGVLDGLACQNFVAFASPFLGVRSPTRGALYAVFNAVGARTLSRSGRQLFGIDAFRDTGRPLLAVLADPDSIFVAALRRFARRTLYANIVHDRSAPYYTTAIAKTDPFAAAAAAGCALEDLPLRFVPGCADIVLDPDEEPVFWGGSKKDSSSSKSGSSSAPPPPSVGRALRRFLAQPWSREARLALFEAAPHLAFAMVLPLGLTLFLLNAVYQTIRSSRRHKLHEGGLAGIDIQRYRVPLWIQGLRDTVEDAYEDIQRAQDPQPADDGDVSAGGVSAGGVSAGGSVAQGETPASSTGQTDAAAGHPPGHPPPHEPPVLALSPEQFAMVDNLNRLGWRKYRVWIHNVSHSHAAIVVRHETPRFDEGKTVLRHFAHEEFLI